MLPCVWLQLWTTVCRGAEASDKDYDRQHWGGDCTLPVGQVSDLHCLHSTHVDQDRGDILALITGTIQVS